MVPAFDLVAESVVELESYLLQYSVSGVLSKRNGVSSRSD